MSSFRKNPKEFGVRIVILLAFIALATIDFYIMTGAKPGHYKYAMCLLTLTSFMWVLIWCKQLYNVTHSQWGGTAAKVIVFCGPIAQIILGIWMIVAIAWVQHKSPPIFLHNMVYVRIVFRFAACITYALFAANGANQIVASILSFLEPPRQRRE